MKHNAEVTAAAFSDDGRRVVTASSESVRTWDATNGKLSGEPMKHDETVACAELSSDGQRVVTASGNNVRLWDGSTGKPLGEPMKHEKTVSSASFSSDGQRIVTASKAGRRGSGIRRQFPIQTMAQAIGILLQTLRRQSVASH